MTFSKWVFRIAGIWGLLVVPPFYFMEGAVGRMAPPAITHPEFYYGFLGVTLAWQLAFLVIATDPVRYRLLILPSIVEKFGYVIALAILSSQGRVASSALPLGMADVVLGILFIFSFLKTAQARAG